MKKDIEKFLHGHCSTTTRRAVFSALSSARPYRSEGRNGSISQLGHLVEELPGIRKQHSNFDGLSYLLSKTAVEDPPLFMSALLHYTLCGGSILNLGYPKNVKEHLDTLDLGKAKGVYLITEIGSSGSLTGARTQAIYQHKQQEFILTTPDPEGLKFSSVSPSGGPCLGVVFARLVHGSDQGVYPFIVPLTDDEGPRPGVEISSPLGVSRLPLRYSIVRLQGVRIPCGNWLSGQGSIDAEGNFRDPTPVELRLTRSLAAGGASLYATLPSAMAAISRISAARAIRHAEHRPTQARIAPGSPLLSYQTQQISLFGDFAEAIALTAAASQSRALATRSTEDQDMGFGPWSSVHPDLPVYKAIATEGAVNITKDCRERCGLHGVLDANQTSSYQGLAEVFVTAGGDNRLILLDAGISLAQSEEETPKPPTPPQDILLPSWWPAVCALYRSTLTTDIRKKLAKANGDWNALLEEARSLGQAHARYLLARAFERSVKSTADPKLHSIFKILAGLHGVLQARKYAGSLLSYKIITPSTVRSLTSIAASLCTHLTSHLSVLYELGELHSSDSPLGSRSYPFALTSALTWHKGGPV